jgi:Cysteine-rich secretory protein family
VRARLKDFVFAFGVVVSFVLSAPNVTHAQSPGAVADLVARINHERVSRGMVPYALNAELTQAAQAHANDIASTGNYSHIGADGSTVFDRVARTGFGAYSWGRRLGENWAWYHTAADAMSMWMNSAPHRANILHALYREIGVGIAPSRGNTVFVVDFGAEPNALPFFIDEGAGETRIQNVILTLSNEDVMPGGDGPNTIGSATQVQISNAADFAGAQWQPFTQQITWTLASGSGAKTVHVKYRDAKGRTATASNSIVLVVPTTSTPLPAATRTRTPRPTATPTVAPTSTVTNTPTFEATETATAFPATSTPTASPTPVVFEQQITPGANPAALGGLGLSVVLVLLGLVRYLATRED